MTAKLHELVSRKNSIVDSCQYSKYSSDSCTLFLVFVIFFEVLSATLTFQGFQCEYWEHFSSTPTQMRQIEGFLEPCQRSMMIFFCESSYRFLLRKKCPYSDLFWSSFSRIQSKCRKMLTRITPNTDTLHALVLVVKTPLEMFGKVLNTSLIVDFSK